MEDTQNNISATFGGEEEHEQSSNVIDQPQFRALTRYSRHKNKQALNDDIPGATATIQNKTFEC